MIPHALSVPLKPYLNPTRRIFGPGVFSQLSILVGDFKPMTILLVLGERSFKSSPYYAQLLSQLSGFEVVESSPISRNPQEDFMQEEINRLKLISYDLVIAIGGGSVLDVSKIFAAIPKQAETSLDKYIQGAAVYSKPAAPLIAVPTTSGTGSEVTPYASLETSEKKKISLNHPLFYPAVALIDPELTYSMPEYVTACTGFDALAQAIESFWAVSATPFSQTHALRAIQLILSGLNVSFTNPYDAEARCAMALGSCEAGLAIAHTKTTAVHSVSYPITAHFGVAHGHACALTLPAFMRFNAPAIKEEQGKLMLRVLGVNSCDDAAKKIEDLMKAVKLEASLSKLGIDEKGRQLIIRDGFRPDRILNNPRRVEVQDLEKILASIA